MSYDNRHVFVLATADTCQHCHAFKDKMWKNLKQQIQHDDKVRVVEINLPTFRTRIEDLPNSNQIPHDIKRFIRWFPTMLIIDGESWNQGVRDKQTKIRGAVFNGKEKNNIYEHVKGAFTENAILSWIDDYCNDTNHYEQIQFNPVQETAGREVVPTYGAVCTKRSFRSRF